MLGVPSATIFRQLHNMVEEGLVEAEGKEIGPGTHFHFVSNYREDLERALADRQPPGVLQAQQPVLFVESTGLLDLARALAPGDVAATVVWAAQLHDDTFVLGLDRKSGAIARGRLRTALEAAGVACRAGSVSEVYPAKAWNDFLAAVRAAAL